MLRQLRLGQLQGCVFTSFGLNNITPEILTLSAPFLIRTNDELNYVMDKNREYMEGLIKKQGIRVLAWSKAGWVRFFSRQPVSTPEDLKKLKLATDPSATTLSQAFKELGYQLVPVSLPDTLVALNSGLIDAIYTSPLTVGGMQLFGITKHMSSFKLSPFLGAVVISEKAWAKIPEALKPILIESSKAIETNLDRQIMGFEEESIAAMVKYGLIIDQVSEAQMALWLRDVEISMPKTLGTSFDRGMYELITKQLEAIRSGKK
jgi:TRAP-type C4-dicarboxylate transport system substrate-binding protein